MVYFLIIATAFLMGICADGILSGNLKELIDDTEEMETTDNTFLKQMKLRYKNCLRIGHEINNTEAFAGKYMDKYRSHGISFQVYEKIASVCSGICVIGGLAGAFMERKYMMEFLMMGFIAMYIINGLKKMIDVRSKRRQITRNIVDFFENRYYAVTEEKNDYSSTSDNVAEKTMEKLNNRVYTDEERRIIDAVSYTHLTLPTNSLV